mmetsp:Transcript_22679/g.44017  ORF Transcript_22679/g.44017 Transcript_22679/m.44017 type:complete len:146 (-) Transcript_22679:85-522(-)
MGFCIGTHPLCMTFSFFHERSSFAPRGLLLRLGHSLCGSAHTFRGLESALPLLISLTHKVTNPRLFRNAEALNLKLPRAILLPSSIRILECTGHGRAYPCSLAVIRLVSGIMINALLRIDSLSRGAGNVCFKSSAFAARDDFALP